MPLVLPGQSLLRPENGAPKVIELVPSANSGTALYRLLPSTSGYVVENNTAKLKKPITSVKTNFPSQPLALNLRPDGGMLGKTKLTFDSDLFPGILTCRPVDRKPWDRWDTSSHRLIKDKTEQSNGSTEVTSITAPAAPAVVPITPTVPIAPKPPHPIDLTCILCNSVLKSPGNLFVHLHVAHPNVTAPIVYDTHFACQFCDFQAMSWLELHKHEITIHDIPSLVNEGNEKLEAFEMSSLHDIQHMKEGPSSQGRLYCALCFYNSESKDDYGSHMRNAHKVHDLPNYMVKGLYQCIACSFKCNSWSHMQTHQQKDHVNRSSNEVNNTSNNPILDPVKPPLMDPISGEPIYCQQITKYDAQGIEKKVMTYPCPHCPSLSFKFKDNLRRHIKRDHLGHHIKGEKNIAKPTKGKDEVKPSEGIKDPMTGHTIAASKATGAGTRFECPHCKFFTKNKQSLYAHIKVIHMQKKGSYRPAPVKDPITQTYIHSQPFRKNKNDYVFHCPHCSTFLTRNRRSLLRHFNTSHEVLVKNPAAAVKGTVFDCPHDCKFSTTIVEEYYEHVNNYHQQNATLRKRSIGQTVVYDCPFCDVFSSKQFKVRDHIEMVHDKGRKFKGYLCKVGKCHYDTLKKEDFISHFKTNHPEIPCPELTDFGIKCDSCNFDDRDYRVIVQHKKRFHESGRAAKDQTISCLYCNKELDSDEAFKSHITEAHQKKVEAFGKWKKKHSCDDCDFECTDHLEYLLHNVKNHLKRNIVEFDNRYVCGLCGYCSDSKMDYLSHFQESKHLTRKAEIDAGNNVMEIYSDDEDMSMGLEKLSEDEAMDVDESGGLYKCVLVGPDKEARFICPWCDFGHTNQLCFISHLSKNHPDERYEEIAKKVTQHIYCCAICGLETSNQLYFFKHKKTHLNSP